MNMPLRVDPLDVGDLSTPAGQNAEELPMLFLQLQGEPLNMLSNLDGSMYFYPALQLRLSKARSSELF